MIQKIKKMVLDLCKDQDWNWKEHIESVAHYAKLLSKKLGEDTEVLEIAALLHDIEKIKNPGKEEHHVKGAEEAGKILKDLDYPQEKIDQVKECILTHSSDENYPPKTTSQKILYCADALSHFDHFMTLARTAFKIKQLSIPEAKERILKKYKAAWKKVQLLPEAQKIAKPKYDAIKMVLGNISNP